MSERLMVGTEELTFHATGAQTAGAMVAIGVGMPPGGGPPMLHRHAEAEVYRVEEGELVVYLEDGSGDVLRLQARAGEVVLIPAGREHTVRNESAAPARAYVVFAPAGEIEAFMRAAGALAGQGPVEPRQVMALADRHGIEMTRPVPA